MICLKCGVDLPKSRRKFCSQRCNRRFYGQRWKKENHDYLMLQNAKHRAKRKGIPFSLVREDIVIPTHCPVLGIELSTSNSQKLDNSASLDRIDNSKGYVPGNVHVISLKANQIKNNATPAELRSVAQYFEDL